MPCKQGTTIVGRPGLFKSNTLVRVYTINPGRTDCIYLRMLLANVTCPLSFQYIRKVNVQQYQTYKAACHAFGLLGDDNWYDNMFAEAALNCKTTQIHLLFAVVLTTCFPAPADTLSENHKDAMNDDILYRLGAMKH